jgi:ankyrin repeat protein
MNNSSTKMSTTAAKEEDEKEKRISEEWRQLRVKRKALGHMPWDKSDLDTIWRLIQESPRVSDVDFMMLVLTGLWEDVMYLVSKQKVNLNPSPYGEELVPLIRDKKDSNMRRPSFNELGPLTRACFINGRRLAQLLVENGADLDGRFEQIDLAASSSSDGDSQTLTRLHHPVCTPLMAAVNISSLDGCKFLVENGADVNGRSCGGQTAIMMVNRLDILQFLIQSGADIHAKDIHGTTALIECLQHGSYIYDDCFSETIKIRTNYAKIIKVLLNPPSAPLKQHYDAHFQDLVQHKGDLVQKQLLYLSPFDFIKFCCWRGFYDDVSIQFVKSQRVKFQDYMRNAKARRIMVIIVSATCIPRLGKRSMLRVLKYSDVLRMIFNILRDDGLISPYDARNDWLEENYESVDYN